MATFVPGLAALATVLSPAFHRAPLTLAIEERLGPGAPGWTTRAGAPPAEGVFDTGSERRPGLRVAAPGSWSRTVSLAPGARLRLGLAAASEDARVTIVARLHHARSTELLRRATLPAQGWLDLDLPLAGREGEAAELELALLGSGAVALAEPALLAPAAAGPAPYVVVYVIDCLRADHVGAYGYTRPTTPHLDALARDSVLFEQAWACASWTKPAVGCLLTGQPGVIHGARTLDDALRPDVPTLAEAFGSAGYASAAFVDNPFVSSESFGLTRGFDVVGRALVAPRRRNINSLEGDALRLHRTLLPWLEARAGERWLLYAHSIDLHAEYRSRPPWTRLFASNPAAARDIDRYDAELRANDEAFGLLLAWLKARGLYERTLIAVTADHGEEFGEHGAWRHGHTLNEGLLHVPLIIKLPGSAQRGRRVRAPVSLVDLAPTLLDVAGVPRPAGLDGPGLRGLLDGRGSAPRQVLFAEQLSPHEVLYAARDERFKAVQQFLPRPERRLFDLSADAGETRDLSAEPAPQAAPLARELDAWIASGLTGWHLAVSASARPGVVTLEVETAARLVEAQRFAVEQGDTFELSPDRRRLGYRFRAGVVARHVVVRSDPADAPLRVRLLLDGRPLAAAEVRLGRGDEQPAANPFLLDARRLRVEAREVAALLANPGAAVRVWHVPPRAPGPRVDPLLEESLRALGYVQ